jgi:HEPN domain-containing protein
MSKKSDETIYWIRQAIADFATHQHLVKSKDYDWACFLAQQSAEKALKAYLLFQGEPLSYLHSILKLTEKCAQYDRAFSDMLGRVRKLDDYYIPTRYPNGLPDNYPRAYYQKQDAEFCGKLASEVVEYVKSELGVQ